MSLSGFVAVTCSSQERPTSQLNKYQHIASVLQQPNVAHYRKGGDCRLGLITPDIPCLEDTVVANLQKACELMSSTTETPMLPVAILIK